MVNTEQKAMRLKCSCSKGLSEKQHILLKILNNFSNTRQNIFD